MPKKARNKPKISVRHTIKVGGKWFKLQTISPLQPAPPPFFPELHQIEMTMTAPQLRHIARGSAVLLVQKILAGDTRGYTPILQIQDLQNVKYPKAYTGFGDRKAFTHEELDPEYVLRKVREGGDPRPLIDTGFYIEHIEVSETTRGSKTLWVVGVPNIIHEPSGVPLPTLVGWLEYGNARIKARPHWRPVAVQIRNKWKRLPKDIRVEALREALRKLR